MPGANLAQFTEFLKVLRDGLASPGADDDTAAWSNAVGQAFLTGVKLWPQANPSGSVVLCRSPSLLRPIQPQCASPEKTSIKAEARTGGWALEKVFVGYYSDELKKSGINIYTGTRDQKLAIIAKLGLDSRLEADKVDVLLTGDSNRGEVFFGVVHVKASFAERRTDDVPMSRDLIRAGYSSPLLTMDCKATPDAEPNNRGELGALRGGATSRTDAAQSARILKTTGFSRRVSLTIRILFRPQTHKLRKLASTR